MMSDHHKGPISLAHMTKERKYVGAATADATKMDAAQDKELDHMVTMLEKDTRVMVCAASSTSRSAHTEG